ncbi:MULTISPECIES: FAD-dependent oxidoreductase [unclassified Nonomuraea]|uniref:NAD(P)/FAD-dependent oxidoreductase n=1 Tax=unclassified Nonomuraea TaxID=2593643 RepID=UPI0033E5EF9C
MDTIVVAGAGHAGTRLAAALRESGYSARLVLAGEEPGLPYRHPPLTKNYLGGELEEDELHFHPATFYRDNGIELINQRVAGIDRAGRAVRLADGQALGYDHLVLATGARNRRLGVAGDDLRGVLSLRTRQEAAALRGALATAKDIVVVGAGFIGMEFASTANRLGHRVTIVETLDRPMARLVSPQSGRRFTTLHELNGNRLIFGNGVVRLHGDPEGRVRAVELDDGTRLPADLVLVAVGVTPETGLARAAGLDVADGVVVDEYLLTSDPHISAIGDCAAFPHEGRRIRRESVQNALDHAGLVAARLTGSRQPYGKIPWFWTEQFDWTLQIAGHPDGHTASELHESAGGVFSHQLYQGRRLIAVESLNLPDDHFAALQKLSDAGEPILEAG